MWKKEIRIHINNRPQYKDVIDFLEYPFEYNFYIGGGSDYHGSKKPNMEIEIGKGILKISNKIVEKWGN